MPGIRPWTVAVTATAVLLAAGCTSGPDGGESADTVTIGIGEPEHLIPTNTIEPNGAQVLSSLFYPLVTFDAQGTPIPAAATSITPDRTNRVWTIALKPGLTFSNGEPVTAQNYIDAWNYGAFGPDAQLASYFFQRIDGYADLQSKDPDGPAGPQRPPLPAATALSGLHRIDDNTFTVTLSSPFAGWASVLGAAAFYPLPRAAFVGPNKLVDGFEDALIGDGPFKMVGTWRRGDEIRVQRVPSFAGPAAKVGAISWRVYANPGDQLADLTADRLDVQTQIPLEQLPEATRKLGGRVQRSPNSGYSFMSFPFYQPEYANPNVRRAISMAIDRKKMTDEIFLGTQTPAAAFVSPVVTGYRANACGRSCEFHPDEARKLYADSHGPAEIRISYNSDGANKRWIDALCDQLRSVLAVTCVATVEPQLAGLLTKVKDRQPVGLIRLGWVMDYPLMESYLGPLYGTDGASNYAGYTNPAFDSLVKEGSEAANPTVAVQKWQAAEDIAAQDMPVIPLRFGLNVYAHSNRVADVTVDAFQRVDVYRLRLVR